MGTYTFYAEQPDELVFTENETNQARLYGRPNPTRYVKDAFHRYLVDGEAGAINRAGSGTKAAAVYALALDPGQTRVVRLRLASLPQEAPFTDFGRTFTRRKREADSFYVAIQKPELSDEEKAIQRQAFAGMLWTKELYYLDVEQWLNGDPAFPPPAPGRAAIRNAGWGNIHNFDVISMPDKWEYPWYAAWDLAFHCIPLVLVDPDYAKRQLELMTREWYIHPNGQLPAYEWNFSDVNPPVHAWATHRVYQIDAKDHGRPDVSFLKGVFHKLLLNFTWWVNRKDVDGRNVFQGGFLGLDNISLFDRSKGLPGGGYIDQSDGTAWMGFYCLGMMKIALELATFTPVYEDLATKFFEHFLSIAHAMSDFGGMGMGLWDEADGFFYDVLHLPDGSLHQLKVRSLVGLMPLLAVDTLESGLLARMKTFDRRIHWFLAHRPDLAGNMASIDEPGRGERYLVSILTRERLISVLGYMLDENEFLSPYGIRSVSRYHEAHPYTFDLDGHHFSIDYEPAESESGLFGGNSNWRGPVWFPINFLIIESLQKFHHYYGESLKVEFPTGSGNLCTLWEVAAALSRRLISLFLRDEAGQRPIYGGDETLQSDPHWRDYVLFHEYFHGDNGAGLGASHQTGWTGLVAKLIQQSGGPL